MNLNKSSLKIKQTKQQPENHTLIFNKTIANLR